METQLYKSGQGYWTRLMTALGGGVLILAGAYWFTQQLSVMVGAENDNLMIYQAVAAVLIIGVFGWMLFRWVGKKPRTVDFLVATEGEMKKVNWPTRKEVIGATRVVIFVVLIFMSVLWLADVAFASFFRWINVLQA
ncbi:MAG: preprotein translocase subunit SecE [Phycisphaeraceae bacterium]